ncbi:MAG: trypsin-like peptidase domain-containing protein, partial [Planctomycetota bacterium]
PVMGTRFGEGMTRRALPYGLLGVVGFLGFAAGSILDPIPLQWGDLFAESEARSRPVEQRITPLGGDEQATVDLFERSSRSVVFIATSHLQELVLMPGGKQAVSVGPELRSQLRQSWIENPGTISVPPDASGGQLLTFDPTCIDRNFRWGSGSGIVWDREGHVITNYHVLTDAWDLMVRLPDFSDWPARLIGFDEDKDLAVLKVDAPADRLSPLAIGRSDSLRVGQRAYSLGNPFGLSSSLTEGIISALGRTIRSGTGAGRIIQNVIQTDAAINPGNSGGPLLDSAGRLIGVTTAMVSESGNSSGIGFAIPVDTVNRIVPDLINFGHATRAGLGIRVQTGLVGQIEGVLIAFVLPGSPAEHAGLRGGMNPETLVFDRRGDIIIAIDDEPVTEFDDLWTELDDHYPGDSVKVTYRRGNEIASTTIELDVLPPEGQGTAPE